MAEPVSREECVRRHRAYPYDVASRLGPSRSLQRRRVEAMARHVRQDEVVLDVGCNSGYLVDFLPQAHSVLGVDVSATLVDKAKKKLTWAKVAAAEDLPLDDRSVDVVVLGEILEHVFDPVAVLREAARVARRLVVGSTPHEDGKWGPDGRKAPEGHRFHVRCYTRESLYDDLFDAGLLVPDIVPLLDAQGVAQMYVFAAQVCPSCA